jgi:predicted acetyltransferase
MVATLDEVEIRTVDAEELESYLRTAEVVYGRDISARNVSQWQDVIELDRAFAAYADGRVVATAEAQPVALKVPGGELPLAAFTNIHVLPSHRRIGLATALMRKRLDQAKDRGEAAAGNWPSESSIHGRFGFGPATMSTQMEIHRPHMSFHNPSDVRGRVRLVNPEDSLDVFAHVYDRVRASTPGMITRSWGHWQRWLETDPGHWLDPSWHSATGPRTHAAWGSEGYVVYRLQRSWPTGGPEARVLLSELMASDLESYQGLWQWCFDLDLTSALRTLDRAVDEPLRFLLKDPRRMAVSVTDGLWLRVLDVPRALTARQYATVGRAVVEVVDTLGYAAGRFRLEADTDVSACAAPRATPDVSLPVAALGAAYLGGTRISSLARAGLVDEHRPGVARKLDAMFAADREPWCPWLF